MTSPARTPCPPLLVDVFGTHPSHQSPRETSYFIWAR
jgi:hypothetical protein